MSRSTAGARRATFDFTPVEHFEIPAAKPGMDFETAAKLSGSRFVVLSGAIARVHRALAQFMLDLHVDEARPDRDDGPRSWCKRRDDDRHRPAAEIRRGQLPDHERLVADPDRRGDADQHRRRRYRRRGLPAAPLCRPQPVLPLRGRQRRHATPPACSASTSSRRSRWSRSPAPRTAAPSSTA